jgi:hypothetical protein
MVVVHRLEQLWCDVRNILSVSTPVVPEKRLQTVASSAVIDTLNMVRTACSAWHGMPAHNLVGSVRASHSQRKRIA